MKKVFFDQKLKRLFPKHAAGTANPEKFSGKKQRAEKTVGMFYNKDMEQTPENTYTKYNFGGGELQNNDVPFTED